MSNKPNRLKKVISIITSFTTIAWLSGVALLVPVFVAHAAIVDGDLVRGPDGIKVYIVKGTYKRHIFNPAVFDMYGHFTWESIQDVDQATIDSYTTSDFYRADGDYRVYSLEEVDEVAGTAIKHHLNMTAEEFASEGYSWDQIFIVNSQERDYYSTGSDLTVGGGESGDAVMVSPSTPAAGYVALGSNDNVVSKIKFSADSTGYTISKLAVKRSGLSEDNDVLNVKLYDGDTQIGTTQALNTLTHKATFSGLSWTIPASGSKTLTVKASVNTSTNSGTANNVLKFGVESVADVTTSTEVTFGGTFPVYGNLFTIAGISVGRVDVTASGSVSGTDLISGTTDQLLAGFNFSVVTEGFNISSISVTESGTSVDSDVANLKLKVGGVQVGNTVAALTSGKATFTGSLLDLTVGTNKDVLVYGDVTSGITSERTIQFQIVETSDVTAVGSDSGGVVTITGSSGNAFTAASSPTTAHTIRQGQVTISYDTASNPADATTVVVGQEDALVSSFKFSATSREALSVTKLKLDIDTDGDEVESTDYSNVQLYLNDSTTSTGHVGSIGTSAVTFEDTNGLFTVPKGGNIVVKVKSDISSTASGTEVIGFYISSNAETQLKIVGVDSGDKIPAASITYSAVDQVGEANQLSISANGSLSISDAPSTPVGVSYTAGKTDIEVLKFRLTATDEAMSVSMIKVRFWNDSDLSDAGADTAATSTDHASNFRLYNEDGSLLGTVSQHSSGVVTFNISVLTINKNTTKTLSVKVDVPIGHNDGNIAASVGAYTGYSSGITVADEMTTTGLASLQAIGETGGAKGNSFTKGTGSFTIVASTVPAAKTVVTGAADVWAGRLLVTANNEDVKVTSVKVSVSTSSTLADNATADTTWSNIKIKVNGSSITNGGPKQLSNATPDYVLFDGLSFTISKDQTATIDIYGDAIGTGGIWYFGHHATAGHITGAGISSGATIQSAATGYVSQTVTISTAGSITVSVDADTPVDQSVAIGTGGATGVTVSKFKFEAGTSEGVIVNQLKLTLDTVASTTLLGTGNIADFAAVKLYDGANQIGPTGFFNASGEVTFTDETNSLFTLGAGESKVITVKADLYGTTNGGNSILNDSPRIYLADVTASGTGSSGADGSNANLKALGANSGTYVSSAAGSPTPQTTSNVGRIVLFKSVPTVALNASTPSGNSVGGAGQEVLRFNVSADSKGDVVFNSVALSVGGNASSTGSSNTTIYKSSDLANALATAPYISATATGHTTTVITAATGEFDGIPVGSHVIISEGSAEHSGTFKVTKFTETSSITSMTITPADSLIAVSDSLTVIFRPMMPAVGSGQGKVYFGGQTFITADVAITATSITVYDATGFAPGDTVTITGYDTNGASVSTSSATIIAVDSTPADGSDTITFDLALSLSAAIDYDYGDNEVSNAEVHVTSRKNDAGTDTDALIGETIAAGAMKTFVVKGDTTGADTGTGSQTIQVSISNISDFNWDDAVRFGIQSLTSGLPFNGGTLVY